MGIDRKRAELHLPHRPLSVLEEPLRVLGAHRKCASVQLDEARRLRVLRDPMGRNVQARRRGNSPGRSGTQHAGASIARADTALPPLTFDRHTSWIREDGTPSTIERASRSPSDPAMLDQPPQAASTHAVRRPCSRRQSHCSSPSGRSNAASRS